MEHNVGKADKVIRILLAALLIYMGYAYYTAYSLVFFVIAALILLTVMTGFCGPYKLLGISTCCAVQKPRKTVKKKKR